MEQWECFAPAKINLALDVLGRREDGYHELRMLMLSVSLRDRITLRLNDEGVFTASSNHPALPRDQRNLALRAAALYLERTGQKGRGARLHIEKHIPVSAGMGGGSGDAAAVLRLLNGQAQNPVSDETLEGWALELGSDVPYCLRGGLCLAEGRGEKLRPMPPLPPCFFVLCTPAVAVSTRAVFAALKTREIRLRPDWPGLLTALEKGSLTGFARRMYNVLESPRRTELRDVAAIRAVLIESDACGAVMSGTGPTVFGLFDDEVRANAARNRLRKTYPNTFLVRPE